MKALFITTNTLDCANHVQAWRSFAPCEHLTFDHRGLRNDWRFAAAAEEIRPKVIFYIGAHEAAGNPRPDTLRNLRSIAPLILLCSDAQDRPWHHVLAGYRKRECFDLQVAIDGGSSAPVDHVTLTPVDPGPFGQRRRRDIRCGFSGTVGRWNERSEIVRALAWFGGLTVRERATSYSDHAAFLKRCELLLNISRTGTGHANHIKGRVLEAGWAGCALLESEGSTIGEWFPDDCYFIYRDPPHAAELIRTLDEDAIARAAKRLSEEVRARFTPQMIYDGMLKHVARALKKPAL